MKFSRWLMILLAVLVVVIVAGSLLKSGEKSSSGTAAPASATPLKGLSLSPKSFQGTDFTDFFKKDQEAGSVVSWAGDWRQLGVGGSAPNVVAQLARQYNYEPIIITHLSAIADKENYKNAVVDFVKKYKPKYIGIGNEINSAYSEGEFNDMVVAYGEVYDAIKSASPGTSVFTIFQLEQMNGLEGGLFGGTNDVNNNSWNKIDRFDKFDIIGFTTYPTLIYKDSSEIPEDYYSEISKHTSKPVIFTEVGWIRTPDIPGWESSEKEQAQFIDRFFLLNKDTNTKLAIYSFLYDQPSAQSPFNKMGLLGTNEDSSEGFVAWTNAEF